MLLQKLVFAGVLLAAPALAGDLLSEARAAEQKGDSAQAERLYRTALSANRNSPENWNALGVALNRQERFSEAAQAFQEASRLAPGIAGLKLNLGIALFRANRFAEAVKSLEAVSGRPQARQLLALALVETHEYPRAIAMLEELTANSADPSLHLALATAYAGAGHAADSEAAVAHMLTAVPDGAALHVALAQAYLHAFDDARSLAKYRKAAQLDPSFSNVHLEAGRLLWKARRFDEAEPEFLAELKYNPKAFEAKFYLGTAYLYRNESARALPLLQEFVKARPEEKNGQLELGRALLKENRIAEAVTALEKASSLGLSDPNLHYLLGQAYRSGGRQQAASREFAMYRRLRSSKDEDFNKDFEMQGTKESKK